MRGRKTNNGVSYRAVGELNDLTDDTMDFWEEEQPALSLKQREQVAVKILEGKIPPQAAGSGIGKWLPNAVPDAATGEALGAAQSLGMSTQDIKDLYKLYSEPYVLKMPPDDREFAIPLSKIPKRESLKFPDIGKLWPRARKNHEDTTEKRTGLLKMIDRQAAMFAEAGPLTVKAEREKLHALVNEYAGLTK
jgi:hypothetical protein